ncbi:MAG: response regulator [Opitutus sp.]|nr:response regulator [Opitutus sp.]
MVVTDYNMPQLNGLEFIRQATPLVPRAAFVLITGHDLTEYQAEVDRLTALKRFLAKPFGTRKLMSDILRVWPADQAAPSPPDASDVRREAARAAEISVPGSFRAAPLSFSGHRVGRGVSCR